MQEIYFELVKTPTLLRHNPLTSSCWCLYLVIRLPANAYGIYHSIVYSPIDCIKTNAKACKEYAESV